MRIVVIGAGHVGLTVAACWAEMGHHVTCVEKDPARLALIQQGKLPFREPELAALIFRRLRDKHLHMTDAFAASVMSADIVVIAVGTPPQASGEPDLSTLDEVVEGLARLPLADRIVAIKSTVPVGTTDRVSAALSGGDGEARVAYTPEFLSEGSAVADFFHPRRVIIGTRHPVAAEALAPLYEPLGCPILVTDPRIGEMIKYASNAFLATRVSFINQIAMICEHVGVDVATVATGLGLDPRIGPHFLKAGIGFGGSCLPKDLRALAVLAKQHGVPTVMLDAVLQVNDTQRCRFVEKVEAVVGVIGGKTLTLFGLAFKGGTSDIRESPALDIARRLLARGAMVKGFDPAAGAAAARAVPGLKCYSEPYEAAEGADAILILADWAEFQELDWGQLRRRVRRAVVLDGRGLPIAGPATREGFAYIGPGTLSGYFKPALSSISSMVSHKVSREGEPHHWRTTVRVAARIAPAGRKEPSN